MGQNPHFRCRKITYSAITSAPVDGFSILLQRSIPLGELYNLHSFDQNHPGLRGAHGTAQERLEFWWSGHVKVLLGSEFGLIKCCKPSNNM